jgi:hypothetical protein
MELWQDDDFMSSFLDKGFKHGQLVFEVILLTQDMHHATILTLYGTNW